MDAFIARQPIFSSSRNVIAYELLFRSGLQEVFPTSDASQASARVMADSSFLVGLETISDNKPAFINVTRDILIKDLATLLPPQIAVIEILETIEPDAAVIGACTRLKNAGYRLALDDFVYDPRYDELMKMMDFIKVDFQATQGDERKRHVDRVDPDRIQMLAEKVETHDDFNQAQEMGYTCFQGFFFARPQLVSAKDIPGFKQNYLRLLQEIHEPQLRYEHLSAIIQHDMSLAYKLLRYINSAYFGLKSMVSSISHAVALLGEAEFKKWVSFITMAGMGVDKPDALVIDALVRARFCELLAPMVGQSKRSAEMFLMGLFSLLDAIVDRPLEGLLKALPIADDIKGALLGEEGPLRDLSLCTMAYERGEWEQAAAKAAALNIPQEEIPRMFLKSVSWAHESMRIISTGGAMVR
jgi:EAL and modified HD-GYP domain-containing signal transduction protein